MLAALAFFAPSWFLHLAMEKDARPHRAKAGQVAVKMHTLAGNLLAHANSMPVRRRERIAKHLAAYESLNERYAAIPTWPINLNLALRFGGAQAVPLLGLTGLSKPLLGILENLLGLIGGAGAAG